MFIAQHTAYVFSKIHMNKSQKFTSGAHTIGIAAKLTIVKEQTCLSLKALNKTVGMLLKKECFTELSNQTQ